MTMVTVGAQLRDDLSIGPQQTRRVKTAASGAIALFLLLALAGCRGLGEAQAPWVVWAAKREGQVVVFANNDVAGAMIAGFERRYPGIKVTTYDRGSAKIRDAVIAEASAARPQIDVAWSTAMDFQVKLINDGYAQPARLAEAEGLPRWATWRNMGFGVTAEPVGFAYNARYLAEADVPRSHAALLESLQRDPGRWRGRIALYDPETSGVGFMYLSADTQVYPQAWDLLEAIARSDPGRYVPGGYVMRSLSSGERLLAYNMTLSYADWWARNRDPNIRFLKPDDYHFTISSVAFITRTAPHPNAARLFLAYMISPEGQQKLRAGRLTPVIDAPREPETSGVRHIRVGPALLANQDQARRTRMLDRWRAALPKADAATPAPIDRR